jgi:glutathione S-transferase
MITVYAFRKVPDIVKGFVRDFRVRWALEEAGIPYRSQLIDHGENYLPEYRAIQPFEQIPAYEEDGLVLFESGAIALHIAEKNEALLPKDPAARARATQWVFAALNSVEQFVQEYAFVTSFWSNQEWAKLRQPSSLEMTKKRLAALSEALGDKPYLDGERFTVGDLMMASVLRILEGTDVVTSDARLAAYMERCLSRPAYARAMAAHMSDFQKAA